MDCTSNCRFAGHADVVLSAVTREELNDIKSFVKYFCENGSRARDSFGRNALHVAASCGKKDVVQWLLDVGQLGVDDKDFESEWTALHRSCYYGHLSCALLLLQYGANIYEKDIEGLSPVELLMFDSPRKSFSCGQPNPGREKWPKKKGASVDVSSWGRNTNFTLGHGDEKERYIPEVIDVFAKRIKISMQEIVICKFHTVFLAANGSVWTCGHGQGGRLGHGHEKTILVPKKIDALLDRMCIAVAAGQDHSVVLCESGSVFTFGLNKFHQMGHHPSSSQYLTPKQIQVKALKGKKFVGIAAGKFHTILYTRKEVYSCGLNAGQLGHSKGGRTQVTPRQVSALHLKDISISLVTCSDAATVCAIENGDVYLIYQYTHRKIIPKLSNISKLLVVGGRLDDSLFKETTEKKCGPLTIYGLYGDGKVFQWRESDKSVRECHWSLRKAVSVTDIACGKNLHIVTDQGEVYFEEGVSASVKKPTKILPRNPDFISYSHCVKQEEVVEVSLTRVRCLHRVIKLACDQHSQNFAVIQTDPSLGCTITPRVTPLEMDEHLTRLYEDAQLEDGFHDVDIEVKGRTLAAHKLILAEGSEKFRRLLEKAEASLGDGDEFQEIPIICCEDETFEVIQEIIEFLYTGTCASLGALEESCCVETEKELLCDSVIEEDIFNELAWSLEEVDFDSLDNLQFPLSPGFSQLVDREEKNSVATPKDEKFSTSKGNVNRGNKDGISVDFTRRNELLRAAKKYRIDELVSRLQDVRNGGEKFRKRFRRDEYTDYHDVVIEAEDGVEFACHKCILVARLEYFSIMLTTGWMESSGDFVRLKMPIPSPILKVIIDFLYTDEALSVKESRDLEFLGKLLTIADQLWVIRLKEICEVTLASLISLKNAAEMLEFSSLYNAEQLKNVCLEFICINMSYLFETGSLEFLSEDVRNELSTAYREVIPRMAWRVLTPSDIHLSVPWPQPECPSKRKTSRSQRRSRTSESHVADGHAVQENGSEQNKLSETKTEEEEESLAHELSEEKRTDETTSSDCESTKVQEKEMKVGLWYRKDRGMNPDLVSTTLVTSTGKTRTISNPLPISRRKNEKKEERQPWGSQSLSPQSSDLRAIMEQEKTQSVEENYQLSERKKEGKSPLGGKSRLSQKERKKLRKSSEEQLSSFKNVSHLETVPSDVTKSSPSPTVKANPWKSCSPVSRPSVSFRELIEEEEHQELSVLVKEKRKKDIPKRRLENLTGSNSLSGSKGTPPSAWQNGSLACSPPNNPMKFNKIQELQEKETANRERSMKKPLSLIQIEDKAIEQLLEHYGGRFNACELIVVQRETRPERSPNWVN